MGQRFLQPEEPWSQALQLLDLSRLSAEEFVGALEAAAQVANARALLIIDALNEGAGRSIWLSHLSAFLALAKRSPWISVVVSARTSYAELVVPEELLRETPHLEHSGFADHEYDASKKFFAYYGIELPSTPLLAPEYRSPLFLRTIYVGLQDAGHTRLPRGFHGISQVFKLYTDAINKKLALALDFDPRSQLVKKALDAVVSAFPVHSEQWLTRAKAVAIVDGLLPNRNFQMSLYQGLVGEGLLVEDIYQFGEDDEENEFVQVGYERLADHLTAALLIADIQKREPREDLTHGSITDNDNRLSAGVLAPQGIGVQVPSSAPILRIKHLREGQPSTAGLLFYHCNHFCNHCEKKTFCLPAAVTAYVRSEA